MSVRTEGAAAARDEAEASALLRAAALRMRGRVDELAARVTARLRTEVPGFMDHAGNPDCSPEGFATIIRMHLDRLVDPGCDVAAALHMGTVGRRQAALGMPPELLLHVLSVGGAVLWQELVDTVAAHDPDRLCLMVRVAPRMWGFRERNAAILAEAYRETSDDGTVAGGPPAATLLAALLEGRSDGMGVCAVAQALGVPVDGRFAVAATTARTAVRTAVPAAASGTGGRLLRVPREGAGEYLVVLLGEPQTASTASTAFTAFLRTVPGLRAGVGPVVTGLSQLHRSRALAELALPACTADGEVVLWEERIPDALIASDRPFAGELAGRVLGPLRDLPEDERDCLLGTFAAWMDCGGSPRAAAERMDCHRNTVLNRLHRLELLTGRRLTHPRDLVDLTLALDALRTDAA
ncbi:helix-turn-helix domain-containing protein [Streptomyces sp. NPDC046977]|uniref:PucR family transcriptional regulator n=1 Tax=Streptomyces sp. NPDC046977 TaxID=3154703 RepID=UPI0033D03821